MIIKTRVCHESLTAKRPLLASNPGAKSVKRNKISLDNEALSYIFFKNARSVVEIC